MAEFNSEIRFKTLALKGDKKRGLELLDKLDRAFGEKQLKAYRKVRQEVAKERKGF